MNSEAFGGCGLSQRKADYVLVRGLGRVDRVPVEDLGIRGVVGKYLGKGGEIEDPSEALPLLERFAPYSGLAAYCLLVHDRLGRSRRTPLRSSAPETGR